MKKKGTTANDLSAKGLIEISPGVFQKASKGQPREIVVNEFVVVPVKALSINSAFKGRRFKTPEYNIYQKFVLAYLPEMKLSGAPYELVMEVGFSNKLSDLDNSVKCFQDCLTKKYEGFDDREVYSLIAKKVIVKKGDEYIKFKLNTIKL